MVDMSGVERVMLTGTGGDPDYLVIGDVDGMALGIKPLALPQPHGTFVGYRVRLSNYDNTDTPINVEKALKTSKASGYKWQKVDDIRASCMLGVNVPLQLDKPPTTIVQILSAGNVFSHLRKGLEKDFDLNHDAADVDFFIEQRLLIEFKKINELVMEAMLNMGGNEGSIN